MEEIPIENIYFLLCYALDHLQEAQYAQVRSEGCDRIWDLLAKVVTRASQQLVKRGLHRDYLAVRERRTLLKGKVMLTEELRRPVFGSLARTCEYDDLSADVVPNRIIRATIDALLRHPVVNQELKGELRDVFAFFSAFTPVRLEARAFRHVQLHRNMRHYRFVLDVCRFVAAQLLPNTAAGETRFRDFERDEARMGTLFEQFVRNFYAKEQKAYLVSGRDIEWDIDLGLSSAGGRALLPRMRTDICLDAPDDKLIIDCKFYRDAFQRNFDRTKFISGHLYQLFAYLRNQERVAGWEQARGMLLYPAAEESFDETVHLGGHSVRVVSIDLGQRSEGIAEDLLGLVARKVPAGAG